MKRQSDDTHALARAIRKATVRLIPFLCLAYTINFPDRVNVGFAALHMNDALGFSPSVYGFGAGIFFLGYIVFEIPSLSLIHISEPTRLDARSRMPSSA